MMGEKCIPNEDFTPFRASLVNVEMVEISCLCAESINFEEKLLFLIKPAISNIECNEISF